MAISVGFIGCGEVASRFAPAILATGAEAAGYDPAAGKAASCGLTPLPLPELLARAEWVLSTVTSQAARAAAGACLPYLHAGQIYVDLNSTAPPVKVQLAKLVAQTGAEFVEGAILGAVGVTGASTRILTGGPSGERAAEVLRRCGLNTVFYSAEFGKASTFKMLRSVFSKGMEALILELLVAACRAGIEESLWDDVCDFMLRNPFDQVAANWIQTHPAACERRYFELVQVRETVREMGIPPLMTMATEAFFDRSRASGLAAAFPARPRSPKDVAGFLEERLGGREEPHGE